MILLTCARLLSVSTRDVGTWIASLPSPVVRNMLDNDAMRIAVALRVGVAICRPYECHLCEMSVDALGQHGLSFAFSADYHARHGAINESLKWSLIFAGVFADRELAELF